MALLLLRSVSWLIVDMLSWLIGVLRRRMAAQTTNLAVTLILLRCTVDCNHFCCCNFLYQMFGSVSAVYVLKCLRALYVR